MANSLLSVSSNRRGSLLTSIADACTGPDASPRRQFAVHADQSGATWHHPIRLHDDQVPIVSREERELIPVAAVRPEVGAGWMVEVAYRVRSHEDGERSILLQLRLLLVSYLLRREKLLIHIF